jgi:hypothetical protein
MGLLYGQGDVEQSMRIAMRAGQDSDCTTHTVGEVLGTWLGFARIDDRWKSGLDPSTMLAGTAYSYDDVIQRSVETARAILMARGGQVESPGTADEVWILPADAVAAPLREQWPASPNPTPVIQAEAHAIGGGVVSFAASAQDDDGVSEYEWYFGDLSHQKGATAMHTYASSGSYEAIVFAADDSGNGSALTVPVSVP